MSVEHSGPETAFCGPQELRNVKGKTGRHDAKATGQKCSIFWQQTRLKSGPFKGFSNSARLVLNATVHCQSDTWQVWELKAARHDLPLKGAKCFLEAAIC